VWRPWLAAWSGATVIAIANGIARRALYEERVGPMRAHYLATATLLIVLTAYIWVLSGRWPIRSRRSALLIGLTWMALTIVFEFGLGHYVAGEPWGKLLEQYDIRRGYVWVGIPLWMLLAPALMRPARQQRIDQEVPG
jgi:hypothetical protein